MPLRLSAARPWPWWGRQAVQARWTAGLRWYRLRYLTAAGPTHCLRLLSRPAACGRVALFYQPGEDLAQLYLGLPAAYDRLGQQMVADFGFSLRPAGTLPDLPPASRLRPAAQFPWERPFLAHLVNEQLFVSDGAGTGDRPRGTFWPRPGREARRHSPVWQLPAAPPPGLTLRPVWPQPEPPPPAHLVARAPDRRCWLLGRSPAGVPLHVPGRVNLYGRQAAVADWLVQQVAQLVAVDPAGLVVIDGAGDLVPRLKRKAAVTRLLGTQLAYIDIDSAALISGFNPLAPAPGETADAVGERWQRWFQGMNVHPLGIQLLAQAQAAGVGDLAALQKWLKQAERQGQYAAVSSLGVALNRLTASRTLREWLAWPVNRFESLREGALFFACQAGGWDRQQLLRAVLLGARPVPGVRLVLHGFPWSAAMAAYLDRPAQCVISNGPLLAGSTVLLTECHAHSAVTLAHRFLGGDAGLGEHLALLQRGEGLVISEGSVYFSSWNGRGEPVGHAGN